MKAFKQLLHSVAKNVAPDFYWNRRINGMRNLSSNESELQLLPIFDHKGKIFLDIGAAGGLYSVNMANYVDKCVVFEPIPNTANDLRKLAKYLNNKLDVQEVALSDHDGTATFKMVKNDLGRSTIEPENKLEVEEGGEIIEIKVPIRTLDSYQFRNVSLIKIDVEGHELSVLNGASETILANMPGIIIEVEERHNSNSVENVRLFLKERGYEGYFIEDNKLVPIEQFSVAAHQDVNNVGDASNNYQKKGVYVNNFIYFPSTSKGALTGKINSLGFVL